MIQIETLDQLMDAAMNKRAVVVPESRGWDQPRAAAYVANHTGVTLHRLLKKGMFIYKAPEKTSLFKKGVEV